MAGGGQLSLPPSLFGQNYKQYPMAGGGQLSLPPGLFGPELEAVSHGGWWSVIIAAGPVQAIIKSSIPWRVVVSYHCRRNCSG